MKDENDKTQYELALLLKNEDDVAAVAGLVRQHNGEITAEPRAKKLALAYKIKGSTEATFVTCFFRATGDDAKRLEHDLRTRQEVIRSMVLRAPSQAGLPVAAMPVMPSERAPMRPVSSRPSALREPKKPPAREPLSNEALENLLKEI
jgi:ribosomal protein S6